MTKHVKLIAVGNSTGAIFPKDVLARLRLARGDTVYFTEATDGSYRLSPYDPEFERQMAVAEEVMRKDKDVLRALAK